MANGKQAAAKRLSMSQRAEFQMNVHFPGMPDAWLWKRKTNDGFTTVPRTLPLVMQAVDDQSKGQPAGHTLFCLWARSPDHPVITIENPVTFAAEAGFLGERAVDTWRRRMKRLKELHLIKTAPGASGDFHYVLLLNPNAALEHMNLSGLVQKALYGRFVERLFEIGAYADIEAFNKFYADQEAAAVPVAPADAGSAVAAVATSDVRPVRRRPRASAKATAAVEAPGAVASVVVAPPSTTPRRRTGLTTPPPRRTKPT